jgi:hypothetical protein
LGADALIGKETTSNDVRIVAFEAANADSGATGASVDNGAMGSSRPTFMFKAAIGGVNIGGGLRFYPHVLCRRINLIRRQ